MLSGVYGISGGTTGSTVIGAVTYDVSQASTYGRSEERRVGEEYRCRRAAAAIKEQKTSVDQGVTFTYSDATHGAGDSASTAFTVHLNGANDTPELSGSLGATTYTDTSADDPFTPVTG